MLCIDLAGKGAVVTGGSKGIGRGIVERLAEAGANVVLASRHLDEAQATAVAIAQKYERTIVGVRADVQRVDEIEAMIQEAKRLLRRIDILVNNAGIAIRVPALDISEEVWDQVLGTNLKGSFFCAQAAAKHMRDAGGGRIINIGSVHSASAMRLYAHYGASKAGLSQLTRVLALELGEYGITVNCVAPGSVPTDINREVLAIPENRQRNIARTALKRLGTPEDIAGAVAFLASEYAAYITGETIYVDGGWTI